MTRHTAHKPSRHLHAPMEWIWWHMWDRRERNNDLALRYHTPQQEWWLEVMRPPYPQRFGVGNE